MREETSGAGGFEWPLDIERLNAVDAALFAERQFDVYGIESPTVYHGVAADLTRLDDRMLAIQLSWSLHQGAAVRTLHVRTALADSPVDEQSLTDLLAEARESVEPVNGSEPVEPEEAWERAGHLVIDGAQVPARLRIDDAWWAGRASAQADRPGAGDRLDVVVTVVARDIPPGSIRLRPVEDLSPFLDRRAEWMASSMDRAVAIALSREPRIPAVSGLEALQVLIAESLADTERIQAGNGSARRMSVTGAPWKAAVVAYLNLTGKPRTEADQAVASLVSHMIHLSEKAEWFRDSAHRKAAIEESLNYVLTGQEPPSREAQQLWNSLWRQQSSLDSVVRTLQLDESVIGQIRDEFELRESVEARWLQAWDAWRRRHD